MVKKLMSILLSVLLILSLSVTAMAEDIEVFVDSGEYNETPIQITAEPSVISVIAPTSLPIYMSSNGEITTTNEATIVNNSAGAVEVKEVQVNPIEDWKIVDFSTDLSKRIEAKEFGFHINGADLQTDGKLELIPGKWEPIDVDGELSISYDANIPPQKQAVSNLSIANIVFVIDWYVEKPFEWVEPNFVLATDADFTGKPNETLRYIGTAEYVEIPERVKGTILNDYSKMFAGTSVRGVKSPQNTIYKMTGMFEDSTAYSIDIRKLYTAKATNLSNMFKNSKAKHINLSGLDASVASAMVSMFEGSNVQDIDLSTIKADYIQYVGSMFKDCKARTINLTNVRLSRLISAAHMFNNCKAEITAVPTLSQNDMTSFESIFEGSNIKNLKLDNMYTTKVKSYKNMFKDCNSDTIDIGSTSFSATDDLTGMFIGGKDKIVYIKYESQRALLDSPTIKSDNATLVIKP